MAKKRKPDFYSYLVSIADEVHSLKNRIRNLTNHWLSDGELKEAVLRNILHRHVPESFLVGRGFIVSEAESSTQLDILVIDASKPTLFKDDSLFIVTPDAVRAIVEVKTSLTTTADYNECAKKLAKAASMCSQNKTSHDVWTGIFSFEQDLQDPKLILEGLDTANKEHGVPINCVAYGRNRFVRYWPKGHSEPGDKAEERKRNRWRCYDLYDLAPAYFVANLVDSISELDYKYSSFAWFPIRGGKKPNMRAEKIATKPRANRKKK